MGNSGDLKNDNDIVQSINILEQHKSMMKKTIKKLLKNVLYASNSEDDNSLCCFPTTRYERLLNRISPVVSFSTARGIAAKNFVNLIIIKANTKGNASRLYRSTPQSVKTAIQKYSEALQKFEEIQKEYNNKLQELTMLNSQ